MRLLVRLAAVAAAGALLYAAGAVNAVGQLRPTPASGVFTTIGTAAALVLLGIALAGTGRGDALARGSPGMAAAVRVTFLCVSVAALFGLAWLRGIPYPPLHDPTSYHNDAIALDECAAQELVRGVDPYATFGLFDCYDARGIGADRTTPLRRGAFGGVAIYPTEQQLDAAWLARDRDAFAWRLSYPALSFLLILPWAVAGLDANLVYVLCLLAAMALVVVRAPATARGFVLTAVLAAVSVTAFTVGGSADLLYALPLVAAWLWRERRWSAIALGVAASVKQLAWPFALFYLIQVGTQQGWREASRRAAIAGGLFAAVNAPFVVWDARAWALGILTPVAEPMFPRGAGLVSLATSGAMPLIPWVVHLALEAVAAIAVVVVGWRTRRTSPELGVVLAVLPLWFAERSLFSYFFLVPLFAAAGIARMPAGELSPEAAREAGALTVIALPRSHDERTGDRYRPSARRDLLP